MSQIDDEEPLDPKIESIRRKMMRLLMISSGIMIVGLMTVLIVIVYRVVNGVGSAPVAAAVNAIELPANAAIVDTVLSDDRIMLTLELPDGTREIRIHGADGKLSATYSLSEE